MTRNELKSIIDEMVAAELESSRLIDESVILAEMNANPQDLKELKNVFKQVQDIHNYYYKLLSTMIKVLDEVYGRAMKIKTVKDMERLSMDLHNKYPKLVKEPQNWDGPKMRTIFDKYKRLCQKFNIKLSDEAVAEKKKLKEVFDKNIESLFKLGDGWVFFKEGTKADKIKPNVLHDKIEDLEELDAELSYDINKSIGGLYNFCHDEFKYTVMDAVGCANYLRLDIEKKISYKLINKIFKTKQK